MQSDDYSAIQILAMRDILVPNWESTYRAICRWYSKTFSTPLTQVLDLDIEFVLQHYLEDAYTNLEEADRKIMALEIIETEADRAERMRLEETMTHASIERASAMLARVTQKATTAGKTLSELAEDFGRRMVLGQQATAKPAVTQESDFADIEAKLRGIGSDFSKAPAHKSISEPEEEPAFGLQPPPRRR